MITQETKINLLKALKSGFIDYNTLAEVGGFKPQRYYDNFNIDLLSKKARQEIENAIINPVDKQQITRGLKITLLNILKTGVVNSKDFG